MAPEEPTPEALVENQRPIEFRSTSEEVAVGALMGSLFASGATLMLSGLVGAVGAAVGNLIGWPTLVGSLFVWLAFWVLPLAFIMPVRPVWRFLAATVAGAAYLALFQWYIHQRDIGTFYPWILTALPFGIVLGAFFEPIRLARGGSTEGYVDRGLTVAGGIVAYGNRNAMFLAAGYFLGLIADIFSLGRHRIGAAMGGLLGGGLTALAFSSLVAWRGDVSVADLFLGSVWNIAWAGTALGAGTGALSGCWAGLIRERQQQRHDHLLDVERSPVQRARSDKVKEAT
jgi:hypothetical protein